MTNPTAAIAIPTYRRERVLLDTIGYALSLSPPPDEIIVVDQTERHEDETARALDDLSRAGKITLIKLARPSLPGARNRALLEARSEIIVFIDDDVVLEADYLARHLMNFSDSTVDVVAGRIIQERSFAVRPRPARPDLRLDFLHLDLGGSARIERVGRMGGGNHSARVSVLRAIGGFDESYIASAMFEDTDAALRLLAAGRRIVFDPEARLRHLQAPSGGCRLDEWSRVRGLWTTAFPELYFYRKHFWLTGRYFAVISWRAFRKYVLRKDHVLRPWLLPAAVIAYGYAWLRSLLTRPRLAC
jgi:GT2 family glycosyltransferase